MTANKCSILVYCTYITTRYVSISKVAKYCEEHYYHAKKQFMLGLQ